MDLNRSIILSPNCFFAAGVDSRKCGLCDEPLLLSIGFTWRLSPSDQVPEEDGPGYQVPNKNW